MTDASPAFTKFMNIGKQQQKNYALKRKKNVTEPHRLLGEKAATDLRQQRFDIFTIKVNKAIDDRKARDRLTARDREIVLSTIGLSADERQNYHPLASNPNVREIFFDEVYRELEPIFRDYQSKMYFATIVDTKWCLPKDAKSFDTKSMALRVKRALRDIGYHGLFILEIQVLTNLEGVYFMPHAHGFIWPKSEKSLGPRLAQWKLNERFQGVSKAKGVTIADMPKSMPRSLTTRFYYATKLPDSTNGYCPAKGQDNSFVPNKGKMKRNSPENFTDLDAYRIARILAQFQIDDTVFAVGEGTRIRKLASKALTAELKALKITTSGPSPKSVVKLFGKVLGE